MDLRALTMGLAIVGAVLHDAEIGKHAQKMLIDAYGLEQAKTFVKEAHGAIFGE